ncbi:MAG: hypothetical protein ABH824_01710 [Nanoarchaeota archaeon]
MRGKKGKKRLDAAKNKRLDIFLEKLEIEQDKREKIVNYVENLTFETLKGRSTPKLRLTKENLENSNQKPVD